MDKILFNLVVFGLLTLSTSYRFDPMKCSYGERGSLTATCVNVNLPSFFKTASYRFDHLDETLQCINCSLKIIEPNTFDISGNQIKHLIVKDAYIEDLQQRAFVGLVFLLDLDLSNNHINSIRPGTFTGVKKIESVNFFNNSIEILSNDGFAELEHLEKLILAHNPIAIIAINAFRGLKNLKILDLRDNRITNVTAIFNNLVALQHLDLSDNSITNFKGNEFANLTSLLELKLDNNKLVVLPAVEFISMYHLEFLGLSKNLISKIEPNAFAGLDTLETLDLGQNQITTIPEKTFQNLYNLISLNLTGNKLVVFQISKFAGLPKLRMLNLAYNMIETIDDTGIFPLHDLHSLDLSNNKLTDLNYVALLHRIPRISHIALQNNVWPCGLEEDMTKFFDGENFEFILFDRKNSNVTCNQRTHRKEYYKLNTTKETVRKDALTLSTKSSPVYLNLGLIVLFICVVVLAYSQYRIAQELRFNPLVTRRRTTSEVKLFHSDLRGDDEFTTR